MNVAQQYRLIQEEEEEERILDLDETDLPILIEHMKKLYVLHSEKAVKDYVSELSLIISFLHLSKNPCNTKIESFTSNEFRKLE
ncbi:nuclear GTPase SLIP-GC-like isoform X2, partial [Arapaima gigas]